MSFFKIVLTACFMAGVSTAALAEKSEKASSALSVKPAQLAAKPLKIAKMSEADKKCHKHNNDEKACEAASCHFHPNDNTEDETDGECSSGV